MENHSPFRMERLAWRFKTEGEETRTFWGVKVMGPKNFGRKKLQGQKDGRNNGSHVFVTQLGMVVKGKLPDRLPPPIGHLVLAA